MPRVSVRAPLEVIMVPLAKKRKIYPANFEPMPRLYLELLENKEKIKKECTSSEFIPKYDTVTFDNEGDEPLDENFKTSKFETFSSKPAEKFTVKKTETKRDSNRDSREESKKDRDSSRDSNRDSREESKKDRKDRDSRESSRKDDKYSNDNSNRDSNRDSREESNEPSKDDLFLDDDITGNKETDPLSTFLRKSRSIGSRTNELTPEKKASYDRQKEGILRNEVKAPPSLQDLEDGGAFDTGGIKNMSRISKKEQDGEAKLRELLFKFKLLKQGNPTEDIPNFTINSDPEFVAKTYDEVLRNLSLTDNVTKYKKYLMFGFMGVEALAGNVLGFDMKGFTKQQIVEMSSYEKLIIELGEKNYVPQSKWPVELRLLGMIIMNAAFFIAGKMALRATGTDVLGSMSNAASAGVTASNIQQRKKQRMNGPSINLDDIPGLEPKAPPNDAKDISFV